MSDERQEAQEYIPLGQRIMNKPILLLVVGFMIVFLSYTVWGLIEIFTLPTSTLP